MKKIMNIQKKNFNKIKIERSLVKNELFNKQS